MLDLSAGAQWGTIVAGGAAGLVVSGTCLRWVWKRFVRSVRDSIARIQEQVTPTPNGHAQSTTGDAVQELRDELREIRKLVEELHRMR